MFELKVVTSFSAAHQLAMVGRKCENLHGHNWKVEVYVTGETLDEGGVLMDFGEVKKHLAEIRDGLDHHFLNDLETFGNCPPSSENIARHIALALQERLVKPGVRISRVAAWESDTSCATYIC